MTSAVGNQSMAAPQRAVTLNRPNMVSVGTIVFLSQELMFF
ncbi:MAG: cytochrome c oxidase subunit 3, partial [Corynebacterium sp.]